MAQVGVHNDDEIAICMFNSVDVSGAQSEFSFAWS